MALLFMEPDNSVNPTTAVADLLTREYDVEPATAQEAVRRYFQVNPLPDDITDPRTMKEWSEATAEDIYNDSGVWD